MAESGDFGFEIRHSLLKGAYGFALALDIDLISAVVQGCNKNGHYFLVSARFLQASLFLSRTFFPAPLLLPFLLTAQFFPALFKVFLMTPLGAGFIVLPVQPAGSNVENTRQQLWYSQYREHDADICSRLQVFDGYPFRHTAHYTAMGLPVMA